MIIIMIVMIRYHGVDNFHSLISAVHTHTIFFVCKFIMKQASKNIYASISSPLFLLFMSCCLRCFYLYWTRRLIGAYFFSLSIYFFRAVKVIAVILKLFIAENFHKYSIWCWLEWIISTHAFSAISTRSVLRYVGGEKNSFTAL